MEWEEEEEEEEAQTLKEVEGESAPAVVAVAAVAAVGATEKEEEEEEAVIEARRQQPWRLHFHHPARGKHRSETRWGQLPTAGDTPPEARPVVSPGYSSFPISIEIYYIL